MVPVRSGMVTVRVLVGVPVKWKYVDPKLPAPYSQRSINWLLALPSPTLDCGTSVVLIETPAKLLKAKLAPPPVPQG
jgi:hypothetical protein